MFTDDEIKEQLRTLGFTNIPRDKFEMFKRDLAKLIMSESTVSSSQSPLASARREEDDEETEEDELRKLNRPVHQKRRVTFPDEESLVSTTPRDGIHYEDDDTEASFVSITTTSSIVDNRIMKRKIARKVNATSMLLPKQQSQENDGVNKVNDDLRNLNLNPINKVSPTTLNVVKGDKIQNEENSFRNLDEDENEYFSDDENYFRLNDHYLPINYPVKSFIRSQSTMSLRSATSSGGESSLAHKSDPLKLFQQYRKVWKKHKAPGEKTHSDLRWSIREQMLEKHVIVRKQPKSFVPNSYVIPTEKKRQQLRWIVRSALANPV